MRYIPSSTAHLVLKCYGIESNVDLSLLPPSTRRMKINENLEIPLYGSLIGAEIELITTFKNIRNQLLKKVDKFLEELDDLYPSAFKKELRQSFALNAIDDGTYLYCPEVFIDFPEELSTTMQALDELAAVFDAQEGFKTLYPVFDGVVDNRLYELAVIMDDFMLSIGVQGQSLLDRLNNLLLRQPLLDLSLSEEVDVSSMETGLEQFEIANLSFLVSDQCIPSIIVGCRLNNFATNYLQYFPLETIEGSDIPSLQEVFALLDQEINPTAAPTKSNKAVKRKSRGTEALAEESEEKK